MALEVKLLKNPYLVPVRLLLRTAEPQNNEPQNFEGMYSGNFIKDRATCPLVPQAASPSLAGGRACNGRRERFHTSIFDIHVIDIRYSQFSTDYFANDDNLQYNLFGSGSSGLGGFLHVKSIRTQISGLFM